MAEIIVARRPNRAPTHPGALLRDTVLPVIGLSVTDVADKLGVTRQTLHRVLSEKSGISPEMALRLGKFCGNGETLWIKMQEAFDLWHARRKLGGELEAIPNMREIAETYAASAARSASSA